VIAFVALAGRRLLVVVHGLIAVVLDKFVTLSELQVFAHHFGNEFVEGGLGRPAEFSFRLAGVAE